MIVASQTGSHWFEPMADHLGSAYLRYSFTKGTANEVAFLVETLDLRAGMRVLDVGCGPGRHAHALAAAGLVVHGIDISQRFVDLATMNAPRGASFERLDARSLATASQLAGSFDVVVSLCQGGFGLLGREEDGGADADVMAGMAVALKAGGAMVISAFSAYFAIRHLEATDTFDAAAGVNHEVSELRSETGERASFDLWTSCFTPRELRLMATRAGLTVEQLWSVTPGAYGRNPPDLDHPEFLMVARKRW